MAFLLNEARFRRDMAELEAYRSTGLKPKQVCALMAQNDPAPLPLNLNDAEPRWTGLLEDDGVIETTYASLDREQWEK
jgi:hypothetical protein